MGYTNSSLVSTTILSPSNNHYGARTHVIDRITPHMVVGQCTATSLGNHFANPNRGATSNYGIAYDGKVGLYCEEKNAAGTSSSYANDNRAVTIEIASDTTYPYAITTAAYNTAVNLMADICKRNGKNKLVFIADKNTALNYSQASNEMLITFHKWFSATACPGFYLESHMAEMVAKVNAILGGSSNPAPAPTPIAKTTFDIAQEVIDNKWGNGQDRIDRLTKSGYDAKKIQNQVDLMLGKSGHGLAYADILPYFPTIGYGSTETVFVKMLQAWLKKAGYYTGNIDGGFGNMTLTSVKAFQSNINKVYKNFAVDGSVGQKTWSYIIHA